MINTDTCKRELDSRFPAKFGQNVGGWKRISKSGNATTGIVRVFQHRKLPVSATVTEQNGAIASVEFHCGSSVEAPAAVAPVATMPPAPASSTVAPNGYLFAILNDQSDGWRHFAVCSRQYWQENGCMNDTSLPEVQALLPKGCVEESEGFYGSRLSKSALRAALLECGFTQDAGFTDFVADVW